MPALQSVVQRFGKYRLIFLAFIVTYAILIVMYLGYAPILWDETPHLFGGLLLNNGQIGKYLQESSFYPPLFDIATALYFRLMGVNLFSGRLVAATFGILSLWTVFEYAYKFYGSRTALLSAIFLATMPGFIILSRLAMIETMLLFFFTLSLFLFFSWIRTHNDKLLLLTGLTLGIGFLVKYQVLVAGIIMLVSILIFGRHHVAIRLSKFLKVVAVAGAAVVPWFVVIYQEYASGMLGSWFYVILAGNAERLEYSTRFPAPIFYLIEMTQPYPHIHPIVLPIFLVSLLGLGLWIWRRHEEDKYMLLTCFGVYIVFTLINNKDWRYITLVFPILAISASEFVLFLWDKTKEHLNLPHISFRRKRIIKVAAAAMVFLMSFSVVYSLKEAYAWEQEDHVYSPLEEATLYVAEHTTVDENIVVLCAGNYFSADMVEFYLTRYDSRREQPMQYPELAVDVYKPNFNVTWLIENVTAMKVNYLMIYEHGNVTYFQSDRTSNDVVKMMLDTKHFVVEKQFWISPRRIYIIRFVPNPEETQ